MRSLTAIFIALVLSACAVARPASRLPTDVITSPYDANTSYDLPKTVVRADDAAEAPPPAAAAPQMPVALEDLKLTMPKGWSEAERSAGDNAYMILFLQEKLEVQGMAIASLGEFKTPLEACEGAKGIDEGQGLKVDKPVVATDGSCSVLATGTEKPMKTFFQSRVLPGHPEIITSVLVLFSSEAPADAIIKDAKDIAKSFVAK